MPPQPPPLPDELVEEVLLRFPPENPEGLVRAGLVCTRWCRLVSGPGFRRRFRELHRCLPMLGMLCNLPYMDMARFVPTTAFCCPHADREGWCVLDARHGRVLLCGKGGVLVVWDPITDEVQELPLPPRQFKFSNAAVLCSADVGACDHLDCHHRSFLVVFVSSRCWETLVYTYSYDAAAWGNPVCAQQHGYEVDFMVGSALVGNALYFGSLSGDTALKYNLELRQMSWIQVPSLTRRYLLTTMGDGGLGIATQDDFNLYIWSRKDAHEVDAIWERRVIELKTVLPVDVVQTALYVIGSMDGAGIIFMRVDDVVYTIDLRTYKAKKVYEGTTDSVFPYVSFYTPALGGACTGEGPSAGHSSP